MQTQPNKNIVMTAPEHIKHDPFIQSANVLFNFMPKLEFLKFILKNKAIIPRYVEEALNYLQIEEVNKLVFPMTCFCDISIKRLIPHTKFYGYYGIGLNKYWGIEKGIQPIHYINVHSDLHKDFTTAFELAYQNSNMTETETSVTDYLLSSILFTKPLIGEMPRNGEMVGKIFHDEKEWRYIPKSTELNEMPFFIPEEHQNSTAYHSYSLGLHALPQIWLNFTADDIKYLAIKDESDRTELIEYILSENVTFDELDKYKLISKIIVFDVIKEDW